MTETASKPHAGNNEPHEQSTTARAGQPLAFNLALPERSQRAEASNSLSAVTAKVTGRSHPALSKADAQPIYTAGYLAQLYVFHDGRHGFSSSRLNWSTSSCEKWALLELRLFAEEAYASMGEAAVVEAKRWVKNRAVERQFYNILAEGGMYIHVIGDGSTFWELLARPLVFPTTHETGPDALGAAQTADPPSVLSGRLTLNAPLQQCASSGSRRVKPS